MNLVAFGFSQLRRHPLLALATSGLPAATCFACIFFLANQRPEAPPTEVWASFSWPQKIFVLFIMNFVLWVPFVLNQAALAIVTKAERDRESISAGKLAAKLFHSSLSLIPLFYFYFLISLLFPAILIGMLRGFVPVAFTSEEISLKDSKRISTRLLSMRAGPIVGLWILVPLLAFMVWGFGAVGVLSNLNVPHRPIFGVAWFVLSITVSQTVLNGALIKLYCDALLPQPIQLEITQA